jgi:hypothetical protein
MFCPFLLTAVIGPDGEYTTVATSVIAAAEIAEFAEEAE